MTLTRIDLINRLNPDPADGTEPIVVTPILDPVDQIGICGIDVRLGRQFIIFKSHVRNVFSVASRNSDMEMSEFQEEIFVEQGKSIVLHPGQLIIGATLEYVSIPPDLECQVEGRSSWARLGLIIATATTVEPNFKGVVTLELVNTGTIPIQLYEAAWSFTPDARPEIDITIGVPLSNGGTFAILGYLFFPRLMLGGRELRFASTTPEKLDLHAYTIREALRKFIGWEENKQ